MVTLINVPYPYEMYILVASEDNKQIHFRQLYIVIRKLNRHYDSNYWLFSVSRSVVSDLMDCTLPGSSAYLISQTRILEWVAIPFSRGSSCPRDQTWVSWMAGRFFTTELQGSSESKGMGNLGKV